MDQRQKALYVSHCVPYPPDKGERVRAFHELKALSARFRITLAALARDRKELDGAGRLAEWCDEVLVARAGGLVPAGVSLLAGRSATEGFFRSAKLRRLIADRRETGPFDLAFGYCSSTLAYVLSAPARARAMDLVDVDSAKWAAYAESAAWPMSRLYRRESKAVARLEQRALNSCDAVFLVSEAETRALPHRHGNLLPVGNGVDLEYFQPKGPAGETASLVFTGTMSYRPNAEGVCWFAREVWPGLRRRVDGLEFYVVGRDPDASVRKLADSPGVHVTGSVEDVRPYLARAAVAVCPLRIARGVQNKVLEAMAMGKAVVASPMALEGLDVQAGTEALCADTPGQWQDALAGLLEDAGARRRMGEAARKRVEASYDWAVRLAPLVALCERLAGGRGGGSSETAKPPRQPIKEAAAG